MISIPRSRRATARWALAMLVGAGAVLGGCTAASIGDRLPTAMGGLPEGVPPRQPPDAPYPAVHATPPPRAQAVLSDEEKQKLEDDLIAARKRAAAPRPAESAGSP
jgi:hypothetical protein